MCYAFANQALAGDQIIPTASALRLITAALAKMSARLLGPSKLDTTMHGWSGVVPGLWAGPKLDRTGLARWCWLYRHYETKDLRLYVNGRNKSGLTMAPN